MESKHEFVEVNYSYAPLLLNSIDSQGIQAKANFLYPVDIFFALNRIILEYYVRFVY